MNLTGKNFLGVFRLNNLRLVLGVALKFYTSVTTELKLKVKKVFGAYS